MEKEDRRKPKPKPKQRAWYKTNQENLSELPEETKKIIEILKLDLRK